MLKLLANVSVTIGKVFQRIRMYLLRNLFKDRGRNFIFCPKDTFSYGTISVGNDVFIGQGAHFSSITSISIGNNVMFGPNVTMIGGDHNSELSGRPMIQNVEKRPEDDQPIRIEDDVWIGAGATILKGVTIGRGAIVAANALVNRDIPPYTIAVGCPAKPIKPRGELKEILAHEASVYSSEQRLPADQIEQILRQLKTRPASS